MSCDTCGGSCNHSKDGTTCDMCKKINKNSQFLPISMRPELMTNISDISGKLEIYKKIEGQCQDLHGLIGAISMARTWKSIQNEVFKNGQSIQSGMVIIKSERYDQIIEIVDKWNTAEKESIKFIENKESELSILRRKAREELERIDAKFEKARNDNQ